jgi:hypothetical protein
MTIIKAVYEFVFDLLLRQPLNMAYHKRIDLRVSYSVHIRIACHLSLVQLAKTFNDGHISV